MATKGFKNAIMRALTAKARPASRHQPPEEQESAATAKSEGPESKETPAKKRRDARPMSKRG